MTYDVKGFSPSALYSEREIVLPRIVIMEDYHEVHDYNDFLNKFGVRNAVCEEVGFDYNTGYYVGLVYIKKNKVHRDYMKELKKIVDKTEEEWLNR